LFLSLDSFLRFGVLAPNRFREAGGTYLKLRPQPADQAAGFFGGPLGVQGDQPLEDLLVGQRRRPAVGGEDGGVQLVVNLLPDALLYQGGQGHSLRRSAGQPFCHPT
jgi:hypothetical protein